ISPRLAVDITNAFSAIIGTSEAYSDLQRDNASSFKLMGLDIVESVLLDTNLDLGNESTPYFDLMGYDFTGIQAVISHSLGSSIPTQLTSVKSAVHPDTAYDRIMHR